MTRFPVFTAMRRYAGRIRAIRNDIRTERFLNSLPPEIRADIGWPDMHGGTLNGRDDFFRSAL